MKKKTIAYLRVSTQHQDENKQMQAIQKYANQNNLTIDDYYIDKGVSAYSTKANKRKGLSTVRDLASKGEIDNLIIFESSRISRQHLVGQIIISELSNNGVKIISITEGVLNSNELDSLLNSIRMYSNESSSKLTSQRVSNAKTVLAQQRRYLGGRVVFGYKVVNSKLVVDETLRDIIINMFTIYKNQSAKATLEYLAEHGIKKTNQTLRFMLMNTTYIGRYYKTEDNKDIYNPELRIISDSLFYEVQQLLSSRYNSKNARVITDRTPYLCEGLLYHTCGRKMILSSSNSYTTYRSRCNCTNQKCYNQERLDSIVSDKVSEWFYRLDKEVLEAKFNASRNKELKQMIIQEKRYNDLLSTKETTLQNAQNKVTEAILKDYPLDMIQILTDNINTLKLSIDNLKQDILKIESDIANQKLLEEKHSKVSSQLLDFKYLYDKATDKEKKMLLRAIVDKIIVTNWYDIEIIYKY